MKLLGKHVQVQNLGSWYCRSPDGQSQLKNGDWVLVSKVGSISSNGNVVGICYASTGATSASFGAGFQCIDVQTVDRIATVSNTPPTATTMVAKIVPLEDEPCQPSLTPTEVPVCTCPTLIFGHHQGCVYAQKPR